MPIPSSDKKLLTAWDIAYATNYVDTRVFQSLNSSTLPVLQDLFEQFNYTTVWHIQDFQASHTFEDLKTITVDNCGVWDIDISAKKVGKIKFKWLDVNDMDTFAKMFWLATVSVPATTVTAFNQVVASGDWNKSVFIALSNQNGDWSAMTVTSVTGSVTGALTSGATGYLVGTDSLGRYGITIQTGFVWAITQNLTIVYNYTPYAQTITGYQSGISSIPFNVYRFRSCAQDNGPGTVNPALRSYTRNTTYFVKFYLTSDVIESYINRARSDFAGTDIEFTSALWGYYVKVKEVFEAA